MRLNNAMTSLQLNMLSRDIASIKVMPITQLGQTIRLPVVPIGGFSRLLVKVQHDRGHCTGSFVGPRLVLTNLHCIGPNMRVNRDLIFYQERYPVVRWHTVAGTDFTPGPRDVEDRFWDEDWAILEVGGPLRDDASQFLSVQPGLKIGDSVMLAGYSGDVSAGRYLTLDIGCPVMAMNTRVIFQCSSAGGSSGSPVLSPTDHRVIVALNHSGVRASASTLATSRNRAGAVRVERFLPTLQRLLGPTPPLPGINPSWDSLLVQYKEERSKPMPTLRDLPSIE
jgi:V8-like Glu-specific endopeptidase